MTNHIAEINEPAPFTTRWTVVFDLGPESCGVNADGSDPAWTPGQDARDPGRGTVHPWMLDIVRRADIPEPARAALLAAAELQNSESPRPRERWGRGVVPGSAYAGITPGLVQRSEENLA